MKAKCVAVIGRPRGGTTVFRQLIGSSEKSFDLGEVFHGQTGLSTNFWGYLHARAEESVEYRHPLSWTSAWQEFISQHARAFSSEVLVFDLKFDYFPIVQRNYGGRSGFFFEGPDTHFVHLRRLNTAAQVLSRHLAMATDSWIQLDPDGNPDGLRRINSIRGHSNQKQVSCPLFLDPKKILQEITTIQQEDVAFSESVRRRFPVSEFIYEELFDSCGDFSEDIVRRVSEVTGIRSSLFCRKPVLLRQRESNFLNRIQNKDEFVRHFAGTGYEWMLKAQ